MTTPDVSLGAITEINELRDRVAELVQCKLALNAVCYFLVTEMGLDIATPHAPMELARLALKHGT